MLLLAFYVSNHRETRLGKQKLGGLLVRGRIKPRNGSVNRNKYGTAAHFLCLGSLRCCLLLFYVLYKKHAQV